MKTRIACIVALLIAAAACTSLDKVRFAVSPSALDYAQFRMTLISAADGKPEAVRLDLSGNGFLELTTGRSARVASGFWKESDDPAWQDIRRDHTFLSESETTAVFQRLVDAGILDRRRDPKENPPPHPLAVLLSVGHRKRLILTGNPEYTDLFKMLLERVSLHH